ncbi:MAG: MucR family transcriptional regulator [Mesorhizobium sp.]|nr:MucR family transcriptional regulator [Mesorhizobium sp.]MCO5163955.1 MucR family transcriptional regulator [Mesorhizobium sp.]
MNEHVERDQITSLTADIVSAYVSNNPVPAGELANLIGNVYKSLLAVSAGGQDAPTEPQKPAVPVKKSVHQDYIVCLEDGKKFKSLKRHLNVHYSMTADEYRAKWGLPADYPMVAPQYAAQRSELAKKLGLGRKKSAPPPIPAKRSRKKVAAGI